MRKPIPSLAILFPAMLAFASCGSASTAGNSPAQATQEPGRGAAAASGTPVQAPTGFPFQIASYGQFDQPWAMAFEPGGKRLFVTLQGGGMKFLDLASGRIGAVSGMPQVAYGGQGGMADIAFAPDYETSHAVYLSWVEAGSGDTRGGVVGRGTLTCSGPESCSVDGLKVIWRQVPKTTGYGQYALRLEFSPDGQYLFVSSGERQKKDPAQDLSNNLGTVVRLLPDGSAAPGNPFADRGSPTDQIWTYGHRNPLGLKFDLNGQLWDLEHGPAGGDEINRLEPGKNYGWPVVSDGDNYNGSPIPDNDTHPEFAKPAIGWNPVIAPGDFIFYNGALWREWKGQALIANLKTQSIVRVSLSGDKGAEEARYSYDKRLRDIAQGPDGALWVIEDGEQGRLLRLTPAK